MTNRQQESVESAYRTFAGEPVSAEMIGGVLYVFVQTELGALRIEHKTRCGRANFSKNLGKWYWCNDGGKYE